MRSLRLLIITASLAALPAASSAQATNDEQKGFWQKGAATDWNTPAHGNSSNEIVYRDYPLTVDEIKLKVQKEAEEAVNSAQSAINAQSAETAATTDNKQKTPLLESRSSLSTVLHRSHFRFARRRNLHLRCRRSLRRSTVVTRSSRGSTPSLSLSVGIG